uniref:B30.2/SPRY domain-containing protein n=1 Tax=Neolamprologus brichardi TaxID=32507 RepID=A0A3Q4MDD2_NEOBR
MIISHIKTSRSLHIMCHIPVFCWITATVLEDVLKTREGGQLPKTLTEMYIHFLVVQSKVKKVKYDGGAKTNQPWSLESRKLIKSLGKLAFDQLQKGNLIFYESDLIESVQPYPDHPGRFDYWNQLLCKNELTGRCYWEIEWRGVIDVAVTYGQIRRRGDSDDCKLGSSNQSWSLNCCEDGYHACHNNFRKDVDLALPSSVSNRVAVYVDCPAGTLSFYRVSSDKLVHLHTFNTTFTEPLYPGFEVWYGSSTHNGYGSPFSLQHGLDCP